MYTHGNDFTLTCQLLVFDRCLQPFVGEWLSKMLNRDISMTFRDVHQGMSSGQLCKYRASESYRIVDRMGLCNIV